MIERIFVTEAAVQYAYVKKICDRAGLEPEFIRDDAAYRSDIERFLTDPVGQGKRHLLLDVFRGEFFRKCPGTRGKVCCNYYVIDQTSNCPFDCSYCFLQSYLNLRAIRFAVNVEDLFRELEAVFRRHRFLRVGTGELADSLALEPLTGFGGMLMNFAVEFPGVVLELKTKSSNVDELPDVRTKPGRGVIGWTLEPAHVVNKEERGTATLEERLAASSRAAKKGYGIAFHLDPVVFFPGFEEAYLNLVEQIFSHHEKLDWMSLAGFRYEPALKSYVEERFPNSELLDGEFLRCSDGKFRYLFPERIRFFRRLVEKVKQLSPKTPLYFCMEDARTWKLVMGEKALTDPVLTPIFLREGDDEE
jgi:spore photoproduct lyase